MLPVVLQEYPLADSIVGTLTDMHTGAPPMVVGWHEYCGDFEHTFTTLVSKHGGRVHGLDTNPNLSFMSKLSLPDGYVFQNHRRPPLTPARTKELADKVVRASQRVFVPVFIPFLLVVLWFTSVYFGLLVPIVLFLLQVRIH